MSKDLILVGGVAFVAALYLIRKGAQVAPVTLPSYQASKPRAGTLEDAIFGRVIDLGNSRYTI